MPLAAFDPRTAYRSDWQYVDGVDSAILIPRDTELRDLNLHVDVKAVVGPLDQDAGAEFEANGATVTVWLLDGNQSRPRNGDLLRIGAVDWALNRVTQSPFGYQFTCIATRIGSEGEPNEL